MKFRYCKPGEHAIEYGAAGSEFFILIKGQASVIIPKKKIKNLKLAKGGHHAKGGKSGKADASKKDQDHSKENRRSGEKQRGKVSKTNHDENSPSQTHEHTFDSAG